MSTRPVQIITAIDPEEGDRHLTVNRADRGDSNVVISFDGMNESRRRTHREAIGIPPEAIPYLVIALLEAMVEVQS